MSHAEHQYLDLVRRVWETGSLQQDRTGVGTRALFGAMMRFDLSDGTIPLLTTKRVYWKPAVRELLWFLTGDTNIRPLVAQGVHIWTDWPLDAYRKATGEMIDRDSFEARIIADADFAARWGDLGPVYGKQWRRWRGADGKEYDQIAALVDNLKHNPGSRRHIFTGWKVDELASMALPPCHMTYQYQVTDKGKLNGILYQRSCGLGLGFPFNIFEASVLLHMLAQQCDLEAGEIVWMGADCHLYTNHVELIETILARDPKPFPKFELLRKPPSIFAYQFEDFAVHDYDPHPHVAAPVAV